MTYGFGHAIVMQKADQPHPGSGGAACSVEGSESGLAQYAAPIGPQLPPSANGRVLIINGWVETAAWPAPFFALLHSGDAEYPAMLRHCESLPEAISYSAQVFDAEFRPVSPSIV